MMFVLNPDKYLTPSYRISPFRTIDISFNRNLPESNTIDDYFNDRFTAKDFIYTFNGRQALNIALSTYKLQPDDYVSIFTTSGNQYISSCVTNEIEKFCKWSRRLEEKTKVVFVNHEFGYPFQDMKRLQQLNLPIIEDCAGSFFSDNPNRTIGNVGDFVIFSFPKMFPLQIGGLLVSKHKLAYGNNEWTGKSHLNYIKKVLSYQLEFKDQIIDRRLSNYAELNDLFSSLGFHERFELKEGIVPGVYMFRTDKFHLDLSELKKYFWAHGVQCSVFYGEESFFLPCHQNLDRADLSYFLEIMKSFTKKV